MAVRIVEAKHALSPCLTLDKMDQLYVRRDVLESRVHIFMLEIEQEISPPIGLFRKRGLPPDGLFKCCSIVNRKAGNIFEAITDDPIEAADLTLRSDLVNTLVAIFKERGWKNADIGTALDIPQSRVSELVCGKIAVLSVQKLFGYLAVLGYRFKPSLDGDHHVVCRVEEKQKEAA